MSCNIHLHRHLPHTRWSAILLILVDIMNFGEQFVFYTAISYATVDEFPVQDKIQKIFIFIILSFSVVSILKTLFDDERFNLFISIAAEIGELIAYIALLKGTFYDNGAGINEFVSRYGILIFVVPVCIVQVILLLVAFICRQRRASKIHKDSNDTPSMKKRLKYFAIDVILFILSNVPLILILFVRDESRFQFFLVDWLILVSFFEGETVERIPRSLFNKEQTVSFDTRILKYWLGSLQFIDICIFRPCLMIMMIVFAGLELTNTKSLNDTLFSIGESRSEPLPVYDLATYIITIVCFLILGILDFFRFKAWKRTFRFRIRHQIRPQFIS